MQSKRNNTFPVWSIESNMGRIVCEHTHTWEQSVWCFLVCSLCTYVSSSHLVNWTIQDMTESDCCPAPLQPFIFVLLADTYCLPHPTLLSSLLGTHPLLLPSCHPLKPGRQRVMSREGGLKGNGKCALTSPDIFDFTESEVVLQGERWREWGSANHTIVFLLHQIISSLAACRLGIFTMFLSDLRREQTQPVGGQSIYFLLISLLRLAEAWGAWSLIH